MVESLPALLNEPLHEHAGYIIKADADDLKNVLSESLRPIVGETGESGCGTCFCTDAPLKLLYNVEIRLPEDKTGLILKHFQYAEPDWKKFFRRKRC